MAALFRRTWKTGKVRRVAWGYTLERDGKQVRRISSAWTKDDAQQALAEALLERDTPPPLPPPVVKTLATLATEYLDFKRAKGKRSIRQDEQILEKLKRGFGADTPITEITAKRIAQYDRDRVTQTSRLGRTVTPSTVNRELAVLRHLLRLAEEWGDLDKVPRIRMAKEPEGRLRFLTEEEIVRLLQACETSRNPYLGAIVTVALNTGMRKGEILGLSWERVDFARGVLLLEHTKSGRRRELPMNQAVYAALSALPGPKAEGLVFRKANGAAWGNIRTAFERALVEAKITDFRFHDLRHTYASWMVMRGRSLKEVQELLGHQEFTMTLRYAHLSPDRLREAVEAVNFTSGTAAQNTWRTHSALGSADVLTKSPQVGEISRGPRSSGG
jgi:integrase